MDEHRCRAWWKAHKHYMRVGDAIVRIVAAQFKNVGTLAPGTLAITFPYTVHCQLLMCASWPRSLRMWARLLQVRF